MATESRREGRAAGSVSDREAGFTRWAPDRQGVEQRGAAGLPGQRAELDVARSIVAALESRPRERCRVSQVQASPSGIIDAADVVLGLMLQRPAKGLIGLALSTLIAGPERRLFAERARMLLDGRTGLEWETRIIAPGSRIGVPVAISVERGPESSLRWYIRDLTELRRAQARVMELEAAAL